ncbi:phosphoribosylamine--glycine ligase [Thermotomaculum hydrothermale]|uniref:phosphoribosylamine--glycine ligase n=1 Tax=Thermotomaculum hydrothermale TaxID=981385 RepID=UPI001F157363|nr:phosphoribosylamine--glycine ligase [Thermotomaculum hydrothermale]
MKVLIIGSGGREHTLTWKISQSPLVDKIYCAPGNAGIANLAERVDIKPTDFDKLIDFAKNNKIDLTVVGPEQPLVEGIADRFEEEGLLIYGPKKEGAILEGSKIFAKKFMEKYNIPTAKYVVFENPVEARNYIGSGEITCPTVIKADGLAAGKGVVICENIVQGMNAITELMDNKKFGDAGEKVVLEEFLVGWEASIHIITDGNDYIILPSAKDHKKIYDGEKGPNTGGMGGGISLTSNKRNNERNN